MDSPKKNNNEVAKEKKTESDITFYHQDLLEIQEDSNLMFLKGYKCKKCGKIEFPKINQCSSCWGEEFDVLPLSRKGKLYSWTDVYVGQAGLSTPYSIGYIDLPEGIRVCAQLEGQTGGFKCNDEVEVCVGPIRVNRNGQPITSYKFKKWHL